MMDLLKLEWLKFRKHKTFRVLLLLYICLLPALILLPKTVNFSRMADELSSVSSYYLFPNIFGSAGYIGSWIVFMLMGLMGVILITVEYDYKTLRQNIITGLSRNQFLSGKLFFIGSLSFFLAVYFIFISCAIGFFHTETIYLSRVLEGIPYFLLFFLQSFAYLLVGFMIGLFVKRTGLSLMLYFAYAMFIENILRHVIHKQILGNESVNFYPFNAFEDLLPIPIPKLLGEMVETSGFSLIMDRPLAVIISLIYISIFIFLLFFRMKKVDL